MSTGVGIHIEGLSKRYGEGDTAVDALKEVNMSVAPGEVVGLIGPSGSGKTTLLKCLGAVIEPTRGRMTLGGEVIYDNGWKISDLRELRRDRIGFIFQAPYLIPFLDVTDNVALLPMLARRPNGVARARALELLQALDVAHRAKAQVSELSGGEQQRVSIARALANQPPVILADEPTAPLDSERALAVMRILNQMATQYQTAIIVVTHDEKIIPTFKRIYHIRDGRTVEEAGKGGRCNEAEMASRLAELCQSQKLTLPLPAQFSLSRCFYWAYLQYEFKIKAFSEHDRFHRSPSTRLCLDSGFFKRHDAATFQCLECAREVARLASGDFCELGDGLRLLLADELEQLLVFCRESAG